MVRVCKPSWLQCTCCATAVNLSEVLCLGLCSLNLRLLCSRSGPRRLGSPASMAHVTVHPCVRSSRRWKCRSIPSSSVRSVARCVLARRAVVVLAVMQLSWACAKSEAYKFRTQESCLIYHLVMLSTIADRTCRPQ
jgi:hypothetical protein